MATEMIKRLLALVSAVLLAAACAGPEDTKPVTTIAHFPPAPTATTTSQTIVVVSTQARIERQINIPTAVPTPTRVPPTAIPQPTATPRSGWFPALFPPDLAGRADARWLPVPYRTQLDGNPYEMADCGPTSLAMVLSAFGRDLPTMDVRKLVNKLQGTEGTYDSGTAIESIFMVAKSFGMRPNGLWPHSKADSFKKWSLDEVRAKLDEGQPLIPQVWYRGLPGREGKAYNGDHYIVLIGYAGDEFIFNDPIEKDRAGYARRMSSAQLDKAWRNSDYPYAAVAIGGPPERASLLGPVAMASARR